MSADAYSLVKTLHVLGATVLMGTGLGTAFQMVMARRSGDVAAIAVVTRNVVRADWLFTTPAVIAQPLTGLTLAAWAGYSLAEPWLAASLALYALVGLCWLPVVWIQIRLRHLAEIAAATGSALPPRFGWLFRLWFILGWPAFAAMLAIIHLMVGKPGL